MTYTSLNLGNIPPDNFLYRIIPEHRLYEMFENHENVLVSPSLWDDPFENFILKAPVRSCSGEIGEFGFHSDLYGQCWTRHKASDAMWRIYSQDKRAVRIRTTIDKLANSLAGALGDWARVQCFIGRVDYLPEKDLAAFAGSVFGNGLSEAACARSLLVKRIAFRHEREVRLLYFERGPTKHAKGLYRYAIDPHDLIDQMMIDPRLTREEAETFKRDIRDKTGFEGTVKRSQLYRPPHGFVIDLP